MTDKEKKAVHSTLRRLADSASLTPDNVINEAEKKSSPLHPFFEWDDTKAANKFRLQQARSLISDFEITVKINRTEIKVQEFVRDPRCENEDQGYVAID